MGTYVTFPSPQFVCPWGTNIFHTQGGTNIFTLRGGQTFLHREGGQTFFVGGGGGHDDVDEEMDVSFLVSEANIFVSEASKLSAGARIVRAP